LEDGFLRVEMTKNVLGFKILLRYFKALGSFAIAAGTEVS
jgi:hypothetical protein